MRMKRSGCGVRWMRRCAAVLLAAAASLAVAVPGAWGAGEASTASGSSRRTTQDGMECPPGKDESSDKDRLPQCTEPPTVTGVKVTVNGVPQSTSPRPALSGSRKTPLPGASGQLGLDVDLNMGKKTGVKGISYQLGNASVTGSSAVYVVVEVDDGWFTVSNADVPLAMQAAPGVYSLDAEGNVTKDLIRPGRHRYTAFKLSGNGSTSGQKGVSASDLQSYLQKLIFHPGSGRTQTVSVTTWHVPLQATYGSNRSQKKTHDAHVFGGHGYAFIEDASNGHRIAGTPSATSGNGANSKGMNGRFDRAYGMAPFVSLWGKGGHLLTLESRDESNLIHNLFDGKSGFIGGARSTADKAKKNESTIDSTCSGDGWYWVSGPSAGTKFWSGSGVSGSAIPGVFANWGAGQPANSNEECYVQYGGSGTWAAVKDKNGSTPQGFYVEFEDLTDEQMGRVSATVTIFDVTFNLRDVKVGDNSISRVLEREPYETTLLAEHDRGMDLASLKVTAGGTPLTLGSEFTFDEKTGKLVIPGEKVTGDVAVTAAANRLVTLVNPWGSEPSVTLRVPNGKPLDEQVVNEAAKKLMRSGYTFDGFVKDGAKWDFATPVNDDITLNAHWTLETPTVTVKPPEARLDGHNAKVTLQAEAKLDKVPGAMFVYQWSKDGEPMQGQTGRTLTVGEAGVYTVTVTATDPATGMSSVGEASAKVTVLAKPKPPTVEPKPPVSKPEQPADKPKPPVSKPKPPVGKPKLVDTGLAVIAPVAALALLLIGAGVTLMVRRRKR